LAGKGLITMLTQRLVGDQNDNTGTLTITCPVGGLVELESLWAELKLRANITTEGSIITTADVPQLPGGPGGM
jgi:hypothetical protein